MFKKHFEVTLVATAEAIAVLTAVIDSPSSIYNEHVMSNRSY